MPYCCVPLCRSNSKKDKISFHQIPSESCSRELWLRAIARRKDPSTASLWIPNQYDAVCGKHFKSDDYSQGLKRSCLKRGVVPSIFPGYPEYLQKREVTKKRRPSLNIAKKTPHVTSDSGNNLLQSVGDAKSSEHAENPSHPPICTQSLPNIAPKTPHSSWISDCSPLQAANDVESYKNTENSPDPSIPSTLTSQHNIYLALSNTNLKIQNSFLKRRIKALTSKLSKSRQKIEEKNKQVMALITQNKELTNANSEFLDVEREALEGSKHAIFIMDQVKSRSKNFFRWSQDVIELCTLWHGCSPAGYNLVRRSEYLNLPGKTTLKKNRCGTAETGVCSVSQQLLENHS